MQSENNGVVLRSPHHIGIIVKNIERTMEFFSLLGLGPWKTEDYSPTKDDIIEGGSFSSEFASVDLGTIELHFVQPLDNNSLYSEFLETHEEGIHHIAFFTSNWHEQMSKLLQKRCRRLGAAIYRGCMSPGASEFGAHVGYIDTAGGIAIEIIEIP